MIDFSCPQCHKAFRVPDHLAGKSARCKFCGHGLTVPSVAEAKPTGGAGTGEPGRIPMRTRRLRADAEAMATAFRDFGPIAATALAGDPPEAYRIDYKVVGLQPGPGDQPVPRGDHSVEIQLTSEYPRLAPKVKMLTPVFHPNIDPATVCVGDHWTAGERLVDLVIRIGEMLAYQAYNIQSPLDGAAAMWADLHRDKLPTDRSDLRPPAWE